MEPNFLIFPSHNHHQVFCFCFLVENTFGQVNEQVSFSIQGINGMDKRLLEIYVFLYKFFLFAFLANVLFFSVHIFLTEVEQSKPVIGVTDLDNPSEIIKNAQRESVMNNSSTKEENKKG